MPVPLPNHLLATIGDVTLDEIEACPHDWCAAPYQYLVESIRKFPKPDDFAAMIREAGFRRVDYTPMSGGIVALHSGWAL